MAIKGKVIGIGAITVLFAIVVGLVNFIVRDYFAEKVKAEIASQVKGQVGEQITPIVTVQVQPLKDQLTNIEASVKDIPDIKSSINELADDIRDVYKTIVENKAFFQRTLENSTQGPPTKLKHSLKVTQGVLAAAKQHGATLPPEQFQKIALRVVDRDSKDPQLDNTLWVTVKECISFWTYLNGKQFGVPSEAPNSPNQYYGGGWNLNGVRSENLTFVNATLYFDRDGLQLNNVRLVNCNFEIPDDLKGKQLAKLVLEADGRVIEQIKIDGPVYNNRPIDK